MFDKLDDILMRLEEVLNQLSEPDVAADAAKFQKLMKEQAELQPIADAYKDYKTQKQTIEESLMLLEEESDEEMREMLKEELSDAKKRVEELEQELKVLLLPKDPNDDKNVIVEFRAGAGGDEAALFTAEICRMYIKYAESRGWKTELTSADENGIGGFKDATLLINGAGAYSRMKYESGTHRVQRVPETESGGRIHTSTISVAVMPEVDDDIAIEWMRIPHFYRAFYVYQYATGFSAAVAFSRRVLSGDEEKKQQYLGFLAAGGSQPPLETLRKAGVDMEDPETVEECLRTFEETLAQLEKLMEE